MSDIVSAGVSLRRAGDKLVATNPYKTAAQTCEFVETLTLFFLQPGTMFYFRRRAVPIADDAALETYYEGKRGVGGSDLWYANPRNIVLDRGGLLHSIKGVRCLDTNALWGGTGIVLAEQLFRDLVPDLGLRSPVYANTQSIKTKILQPLRAWLDPAGVEDVNNAGELVTLQGVFGLLIEPMRSLHVRRPKAGALQMQLLTRRLQYLRECPRGLWRNTSRATGRGITPGVMARGITTSIKKMRVPVGPDWWPRAEADSHGTPMPRPRSNPPAAAHNQQLHNFQILAGTRRVYQRDRMEVLVLWSDVAYGIKDATWEPAAIIGHAIQAMRDTLRETTLPRVRQKGPWRPDRGGPPAAPHDPDDAYTKAAALASGVAGGLMQRAAALGTAFHQMITQLLLVQTNNGFESPLFYGPTGAGHLPPARGSEAIQKRVRARTRAIRDDIKARGGSAGRQRWRRCARGS